MIIREMIVTAVIIPYYTYRKFHESSSQREDGLKGSPVHGGTVIAVESAVSIYSLQFMQHLVSDRTKEGGIGARKKLY